MEHILLRLQTIRQTGQTSICINSLIQNPDARMLVGTYQQRKFIHRSHPNLAIDRIMTVTEFFDEPKVWGVPLIWDNTAVEYIIHRMIIANKD